MSSDKFNISSKAEVKLTSKLVQYANYRPLVVPDICYYYSNTSTPTYKRIHVFQLTLLDM